MFVYLTSCRVDLRWWLIYQISMIGLVTIEWNIKKKYKTIIIIPLYKLPIEAINGAKCWERSRGGKAKAREWWINDRFANFLTSTLLFEKYFFVRSNCEEDLTLLSRLVELSTKIPSPFMPLLLSLYDRDRDIEKCYVVSKFQHHLKIVISKGITTWYSLPNRTSTMTYFNKQHRISNLLSSISFISFQNKMMIISLATTKNKSIDDPPKSYRKKRRL